MTFSTNSRKKVSKQQNFINKLENNDVFKHISSLFFILFCLFFEVFCCTSLDHYSRTTIFFFVRHTTNTNLSIV